MKINLNKIEGSEKRERKTTRKDKILEVVTNLEGKLTEYQLALLKKFAYFMVGKSKIAPKEFQALVNDFINLVPEHKKTSQLEYVNEKQSRNLVPSWFRDGSNQGFTASIDNMYGKHKKADKTEIDMSQGF